MNNYLTMVMATEMKHQIIALTIRIKMLLTSKILTTKMLWTIKMLLGVNSAMILEIILELEVDQRDLVVLEAEAVEERIKEITLFLF